MGGSSRETVNGNEAATNGFHIIRHTPSQPYTKLSASWFDLRVFYVRFSNFTVHESTPEFLTLNHIPLDPDTLLEVNGVRCSIYSDGISSLLRRDRVDKKSEEATFVCTDSIKFTGSVKFDVFNEEDHVLTGVLEMPSSSCSVGEAKNSISRWSLSCHSAMTVGTGFLMGKHNGRPEYATPTIDVYVAGTFSGAPIILTKTLRLSFRRKHNRKVMLDAIPEYETAESQKDAESENTVPAVLDLQMGNMHKGYKGSSQGTHMTAEASNQIIPYAKGHRSQPIGDLSMAVAYAFNRRSMERTSISINMVEWASSGHRFPTLTRLHINEISKGAQKLNQILKACSVNGLSIDRCSIEVAKQLLKGARDLEESLRMLVSLQEEPEYMVSPRRKSSIRLLEDDEDGSPVAVAEQKHVDRPVFSFDYKSKPEARASMYSRNSPRPHSASYGSDFEVSTAISIQRTRRIPNVVAKLMGLEELPPDVNKMIRPEKPPVSDCILDGVLLGYGKSRTAEYDDKAMSQSSKTTKLPSKKLKQHQEMYMSPHRDKHCTVPDKKNERQNKEVSKETEGGDIKNKELKGKESSKTKEAVIRDDIQRTPMVTKTRNKEQKATASKLAVIQVNHENKPKGVRFHKSDERNLQREINKQSQPQVRNTKGGEALVDDSQKITHNVKSTQTNQPPVNQAKTNTKNGTNGNAVMSVREENSTSSVADPKGSIRLKSHKKATSRVEESKLGTTQISMEETSAGVPAVEKVQSAKMVPKRESRHKGYEVMTKKTQSVCKTERKAMQRASISNQAKQRGLLKISSHRGAEQTSNSKANESGHCQKMNSGHDYDQDAQPPKPSRVHELKPQTTVLQQAGCVLQDNSDLSHVSHQKQLTPSKLHTQEPLTESEIHLKQILITCQLFLNTAEALFKLNIPTGILSANEHHICEDQDSKLILDCSYEILKRKGRKQELYSYTSIKIFGEVKSLDDLVKQVHKDLEILRCYGRERRNKYDDAEYLLKMLDRDVYYEDPDVNSMWDLGWNGTVFAYVEREEVVREVERVMLDEFMDEIAKDLFFFFLRDK